MRELLPFWRINPLGPVARGRSWNSSAKDAAEESLPAVMTAKEAVNRAFETAMPEVIRLERRVFQALVATEDRKEGIAAIA